MTFSKIQEESLNEILGINYTVILLELSIHVPHAVYGRLDGFEDYGFGFDHLAVFQYTRQFAIRTHHCPLQAKRLKYTVKIIHPAIIMQVIEKNAFITIKQERVVLLRWGSVLRTSPSKTCHVVFQLVSVSIADKG